MLAAHKIAKTVTKNTFIFTVACVFSTFFVQIRNKTRSQPHFNSIGIRAIKRMHWKRSATLFIYLALRKFHMLFPCYHIIEMETYVLQGKSPNHIFSIKKFSNVKQTPFSWDIDVFCVLDDALGSQLPIFIVINYVWKIIAISSMELAFTFAQSHWIYVIAFEKW